MSLITVSVFRFIPAFLSINSAKYYISLLTPNLINLSTSITSFKERNVKNNEVKNINYPIFSKELENKFISLKNVSFSYPGSDTSPLRRVTLDIEKNKIIGITGQTGAGKSTLFYICSVCWNQLKARYITTEKIFMLTTKCGVKN